jgi:hypothetical protein
MSISLLKSCVGRKNRGCKMEFSSVLAQLVTIYERAIETSVSVKQHYPACSEDTGFKKIGELRATSIALKNVPYKNIYTELESNDQYHLKLPDGGLLIFQYTFAQDGSLLKHRLGFFPSPILPTAEEAPELYERDDLYADILTERIVRFPVRFDFDPLNYRPRVHPHSHVTFGQFDNCRIPVTCAVSPNTFFLFILRNFYFLLYRQHQNKFDKRIARCAPTACITEHELTFPHFSIKS